MSDGQRTDKQFHVYWIVRLAIALWAGIVMIGTMLAGFHYRWWLSDSDARVSVGLIMFVGIGSAMYFLLRGFQTWTVTSNGLLQHGWFGTRYIDWKHVRFITRSGNGLIVVSPQPPNIFHFHGSQEWIVIPGWGVQQAEELFKTILTNSGVAPSQPPWWMVVNGI